MLSKNATGISIEEKEDIVVTKEYTIINGVDIKSNHVATIDEDFKDNQVIVTLKHDYSKINAPLSAKNFKVEEVKPSKSQNIGSFKQTDIVEVKDLTYIDNPEKALINEESFHQILTIKLRNPGKENVLAAISSLEKLDIVLAAEPDYNYTAVDDTAPNDTWYTTQTNLTRINYETVWDFVINNNITTPTIKVGVFEKGLESTHEDLSQNIIPGNRENQGDISHGTHVAGIIGAVTNNNRGITGVGNGRHNRNIIQIACLDRSSFVSSLTYAKNNNISIINASFCYTDGNGNNAAFNTSHANAIQNYPGLLVCSAGNNGWDMNTITSHQQYPACYTLDNVITVAATARNSDTIATTADGWTNGSNWGTHFVHLAAPGTGIISTLPNNQYGSKSGTSMAAPHVAGVAALIKSIRPDLNGTQIKHCIMMGTDYVSNLHNKCLTRGRLNAYQALQIAQNYKESDLIISTLSGDFNGDQKDDVATVNYLGFGQTRIKVALSNGNSFSTQSTWLDTGPAMFDSTLIKGRVVSGDFNGDGKDDIASMMDYGQQNMKIFVWVSTGSGFISQTWLDSTTPMSYNANLVTGRMVAGDFDGNGKEDLSGTHDYTSHVRQFVWKSNGSSFVAFQTWLSNMYAY